MRQVPAYTHILVVMIDQFKYATISLRKNRVYSDEWGNPNYLTYILIHQDASAPDVLNSIIQVAMDNQMPNIFSGRNNLILRPLKEIYLDNGIINRVGDTGDKRNVFILGSVGLLIQVMAMLNIDNIKWVAVAFVIATPLAWYAMNRWLQNFAYRTDLSWWVFALAGLLALGIALLTASWQTWMAARRNPIEALRYE